MQIKTSGEDLMLNHWTIQFPEWQMADVDVIQQFRGKLNALIKQEGMFIVLTSCVMLIKQGWEIDIHIV